MSLVANSTGSAPGRAKAWKAATPASPSRLPGMTGVAGAQNQARQKDSVATPSRHRSDGRNASGAIVFAEGRLLQATALNGARGGCSPEGWAPAAPDRAALPKDSF